MEDDDETAAAAPAAKASPPAMNHAEWEAPAVDATVYW